MKGVLVTEPIINVIKEVFERVRGVDPALVVPDARLVDDLGIDSLDAIEIVLALEGHYGKELEGEDLEDLKTVSDVVALVGTLVE